MKSAIRMCLAALLASPIAVRSEEPAPAAAPEAVAAPAAESAPAPKIVCDAPTHDFGTADSSQTIDHEYVIKNEGDLSLEIGQVRPSCGCTVANISERSVPPGGETRVTARLSLAGRMGRQQKSIVIESNDPKQPQFILTLQGEVSVAVNVQPDRIVFGQLNAEAGQSAEVQLNGSGTPPFHITNVETSSSNIVAKYETTEDGKSYKLNVQVAGPLPDGAFNGYVRVSTDHPAKPVIEIPVTAMVVGALLVAPQEILLAAQSPDGQVQTRYVIVRSSEGKTFKIESVDTPDSSVTTQIFPFGENGFRIQIDNIRADTLATGGSIVIHTDMPGMNQITIPIRVAQQ